MKRLLVLVSGNKRPLKLKLRPGTKTSDILDHLKLDEHYVFSPAADPAKPFAGDADVYSIVTDGDKLIATFSTAEADAFMERIAFGEGSTFEPFTIHANKPLLKFQTMSTAQPTSKEVHEWKKPNVFRTLPTGESKKISPLPNSPDQEEDLQPRDDAFDPENNEPDWLWGGFNPS